MNEFQVIDSLLYRLYRNDLRMVEVDLAKSYPEYLNPNRLGFLERTQGIVNTLRKLGYSVTFPGQLQHGDCTMVLRAVD